MSSYTWELTGETRIRQTWNNKIIVQVKENEQIFRHIFRWRDANLDDLQNLAKPIQVIVPALKLAKKQ